MLKKAEGFALHALQDPQKAEEFASMAPDEYAERKGIEIQNAGRRGSNLTERTITKTMTKPEMESLLDEVDELLEGALDPTLTREEVIGRVIEASGLIGGPADESDEEDKSDESDED
jgi:hypothetical protein